jgi:hypothetical protein
MPGRGTAPGPRLYPECGTKQGLYRHRKHRTLTCAGCREVATQLHAEYRKHIYMEGMKLTSSLGCQRRLRALSFMGWSQKEVARRCGATLPTLNNVFRQQQVTVDLARRVDGVYRELVWTPAPGKVGHLTRVRARNRGWPGPLDWDDIDNPHEVPLCVVEQAYAEHREYERAQRKVLAKRERRAHLNAVRRRAAMGLDQVA